MLNGPIAENKAEFQFPGPLKLQHRRVFPGVGGADARRPESWGALASVSH